MLLLVVMALWWFVFRPITAEQGWERVSDRFAICGEQGAREAGCVVDGDTVVLGFGGQQRRIRLTGFDTPELDGACEAERALARTARARLHQWLAEGPFEWDGAGDPPRDQYGRELREVRRTQSDQSREYLAEVMIDADLASESGWGSSPKDWCG
ncbi:hypothetical protein [uncultured Erythrobacter sp.]|uniref:thermonuclease family protein n=1 Tax=uncultured Erythrobacter sp. TaxID=263913 RepID=UPI00260BF638|nr:hypothetical protein [uncultured Erythrobacter sp.]